MTNSQLSEAPATRPTGNTLSGGAHLLEHPRGRGFSVVSRLAREVQAPAEPPRHRREDVGR